MPELAVQLARLEADLRSGALDRAALFWLKAFVDSAGSEGAVRSDHWVEHGLAAAATIPGLDAASIAPRRDLIARYELFRFVRLKDQAEFSGQALAELDWQRKYRVSLRPEFAWDLPELQRWTAEQWAELGGVDPQFAALEGVLEKYFAGISTTHPHPRPLSQKGEGSPDPTPSPSEEEGWGEGESSPAHELPPRTLLPPGNPPRRADHLRRLAAASRDRTHRSRAANPPGRGLWRHRILRDVLH